MNKRQKIKENKKEAKKQIDKLKYEIGEHIIDMAVKTVKSESMADRIALTHHQIHFNINYQAKMRILGHQLKTGETPEMRLTNLLKSSLI